MRAVDARVVPGGGVRPEAIEEPGAGGALRSRQGASGFAAGASLLAPTGTLARTDDTVLAQTGTGAGAATCSAAAARFLDAIIAEWKAARDGTGECRESPQKKREEPPHVAWAGRPKGPALPDSEPVSDVPEAPLWSAAEPVLAGPKGSREKKRVAAIDRTIALLEEARKSCALPVLNPYVPVYSGKRYISKVVERVLRGDRIVVLDVDGDWLKVKTPSGATGWTNKAQATPPPPASLCSKGGGGGREDFDDGGGAGRG